MVVRFILLLPLAAAFAPKSATRRRETNVALPAATPVFGILGRFRKPRTVQQVKEITPGTAIADVDVERLTFLEDGTTENSPVSIKDVLGSEKSILVGMPGAFTPICSKEHLPGFIKNADKFDKLLGIDRINIVTTNDRFVNSEWMSAQGALKPDSKITMLSDGDGTLVKSLGLAEDMGFGFDVRSKRFVLLAEDGVVSSLFTDEGMEDCSSTSAESVIAALSPSDVTEADVDPTVVGGVLAGVLVLVLGWNVVNSESPAPVMTQSVTPTNQVAPAKQKAPAGKFSLLNEYKADI